MSLIKRRDSGDIPAAASVSPLHEIGAYEALWLEDGATFKKIAERFQKDPSALPSDFVPPEKALPLAAEVVQRLHSAGAEDFGIRIHHAGDYPERLRHARYPVELLYYRGAWEITEKPSVAIVGSREPSPEGIRRASRIARELVKQGIVVVSGLAAGIDTAAHLAALSVGGETIAVVGTPLDTVYPKQNADLQRYIASRHLLISQVPVLRYHAQTYRQNRLFFPERNATMSALTDATIIVEAGETSGTLTQARAALYQGRKLFILESCFQNKALTWPARFEQQGAIRVRKMNDILDNLYAAL
ncbi:DNA-processing protein DprA [Nitratireductor sp. CH_MIT9313-5]|uniref:DNA-processing protein DprA n=1 Tax=Nitratireductor sp. CH_MIT9313-5 TaxID=3107764 RepID=UPI00300A40A1